MEEKDYMVVFYREEAQEEWDYFVMEQAVNGTFLQTRRFLNYHDKDKFIDTSFMVYDKKNKLCAVCPACQVEEDGMKVCYSHGGSTFGGLILNNKSYVAHKVISIIQICENFLKEKGFNKIIYKITSDLFCKERTDLLCYCMYYNDYKEYDELNLYIDFLEYKEDVLSNFSQGKRTNVYNCIKAGVELRKLSTQQEMEEFYEVLCENLLKYDLKPIHTVRELMEFKDMRLVDECEFYGIYQEDKMIAGSMMFYFLNVNVAHTQYLCARAEYATLSPMTYMYYCMIVEAKKRGFKRLTWGITSEHNGKKLNFGLTRSKEAYGSKYSVSKIYSKVL